MVGMTRICKQNQWLSCIKFIGQVMHFPYDHMCSPDMHRVEFATCARIENSLPEHSFLRVFNTGRGITLNLPIM